MLPRKVFKNSHTVVAMLVLFEQILLKFFAPNSECFTKYDAYILFVHFRLCVHIGRKASSFRKSSKLWKSYIHQNMFENGWWGGMHPPWRCFLFSLEITSKHYAFDLIRGEETIKFVDLA